MGNASNTPITNWKNGDADLPVIARLLSSLKHVQISVAENTENSDSIPLRKKACESRWDGYNSAANNHAE